MAPRDLMFITVLLGCGTHARELSWASADAVEVENLWKLDVAQNEFVRANGWRKVSASPRKVPSRHHCDENKKCAWVEGSEVCVSLPEDRAVESCWPLPPDPTTVEAERAKIADRLFAKSRPVFLRGNDGTCESWDFTKESTRGGQLVHVFVADGKRTQWTYGFDWSGEGVGLSGPTRKALDEASPAISSACLSTYFYERIGDDEIVFSKARWYLSSAACEAARQKREPSQGLGCR